MAATLTKLERTTYHGVTATLRRIADEIDAGQHGVVENAVVALEQPHDGESNRIAVFGLGVRSGVSETPVLLQRALLAVLGSARLA